MTEEQKKYQKEEPPKKENTIGYGKYDMSERQPQTQEGKIQYANTPKEAVKKSKDLMTPKEYRMLSNKAAKNMAANSFPQKENIPYEDPFYDKPKASFTQPGTLKDEDSRERYEKMKDTIGASPNLIQEGAKTGDEASKAFQNIEIPKSKLVTWGDILKSDEFKGQRVPYIANAIGSALASGLTRQDYQSYIGQHNQQMADTYAQNKAARDTAATKAAIEDLEAGNKAQMGKQIQMSDAITEQALKQYGLLEDAENKKLLLQKLYEDATGGTESKLWKDMSDEEKLGVMALMQVYNGDYSIASMFLQKYGDDMFDFFDAILAKLGYNKEAGDNYPPPSKIKLYNGEEIDEQELNDNPKKYMELPSRDGKSTVIVPKNQSGAGKKGTTVEQRTQFYKELYDNPHIAPEEADGLIAEYVSNSLMTPTHAQQEYKKYKAQRDEELRNMNAAQAALRKKADYVDKQLKAIEKETDPYKIKEKLEDAVLTSSLEETRGIVPVYQKRYADMLDAANVGIVRDKIKNLRENERLTASDRNLALENLVKEYATTISTNPELMKEMDDYTKEVKLDMDYREPFNNRVAPNNVVFAPKGKYDNTTYITKDGDFNIGNGVTGFKVYDTQTRDFGSPENAKKYVDYMTNILYRKDKDGNILKDERGNPKYNLKMLIDPNKLDKDISIIFKGTPVYKALGKMVANQNLRNMANATKKNGTVKYPELKDAFDNMEAAYNYWTNVR